MNRCVYEMHMRISGDEPCDNGQGSPVDDGNYEHPDNCRKFLMCSNGRATFMDCAGGIFNPTTGDCDITDNGQNCPA